jgi:hypothetical protein
LHSHARVRVEGEECVRQRDVCKGPKRRLVGAQAASEALAGVAGTKVCAQRGAAGIVEEPVEIVRDRPLRVAAGEQPLCHGGMDAARLRILRLAVWEWKRRRRERWWWKRRRRWKRRQGRRRWERRQGWRRWEVDRWHWRHVDRRNLDRDVWDLNRRRCAGRRRGPSARLL